MFGHALFVGSLDVVSVDGEHRTPGPPHRPQRFSVLDG
jgi:hypothetical protein